MIIALETEELLVSLGATAVDMASSTREALRLIDAAPPDRALLDVNLGGETSIAVARRLFALGIPYAFATGYGDGFRIPPDLAEVRWSRSPTARRTCCAPSRPDASGILNARRRTRDRSATEYGLRSRA